MNARTPVAFFLAVAFTVLSLPAAADPPGWSGMWQVRERYHRPSDDEDDYRVVYIPQSRAEAPQPDELMASTIPVARGLPYGFNRGTCDRALLAVAAGQELAVPGAVGQAMDAADRECVRSALDALPDLRPIAWIGDSGELFRMVAERTYIESGIVCRSWRASASLAGRKQQTFGTFCRKPDGQWEWVG